MRMREKLPPEKKSASTFWRTIMRMGYSAQYPYDKSFLNNYASRPEEKNT